MAKTNICSLSENDILEIKEKSLEKLKELHKTKDIIGKQIFFILDTCAKVIYYPLGADAPWGFTDVKGTNTSDSDKVFVVLNSSVSVECQVFAAAHELYHICYDRKEDIITGSDSENDLTELKANRFAAEFLVSESLLKREFKSYVNDPKNVMLKDILKLSELFEIPYKTMVKRLYETGLISYEMEYKFLQITEKEIGIERKRYSISTMIADNRIAIADHTALSIEAYEKGLISYERLEYYLAKSKLVPDDVGIKKKDEHLLPSDDELDDIMGE